MSALAKARTYWRLGPANLARARCTVRCCAPATTGAACPLGEPLRGPFFVFPRTARLPHRPAITDAAAWTAKAQRVLGGELPVFSNGWRGGGFSAALAAQPHHAGRRTLARAALVDAARLALAGGDVKGWGELAFRRPADPRARLVAAAASICARASPGGWRTGAHRTRPTPVCSEVRPGNRPAPDAHAAGGRPARALGGVKPAPALTDFVCQHAERIAPTMLYAVAQDNNHGTSEAAALYVAGLFLARHGDAAAGRRYAALGRRWLEERIGRLVMPDGLFSQRPTNYHRLMLDTCAGRDGAPRTR